jgi:hypothetical protein
MAPQENGKVTVGQLADYLRDQDTILAQRARELQNALDSIKQTQKAIQTVPLEALTIPGAQAGDIERVRASVAVHDYVAGQGPSRSFAEQYPDLADIVVGNMSQEQWELLRNRLTPLLPGETVRLALPEPPKNGEGHKRKKVERSPEEKERLVRLSPVFCRFLDDRDRNTQLYEGTTYYVPAHLIDCILPPASDPNPDEEKAGKAYLYNRLYTWADGRTLVRIKSIRGCPVGIPETEIVDYLYYLTTHPGEVLTDKLLGIPADTAGIVKKKTQRPQLK